MIVYGKSDIGKVRDENQDSFGITELFPGVMLCVICDGMGGCSGGAVASQIALETFTDTMREMLTPDTEGADPGLSDRDVRQAMKEAVCRLNIERMEFPGFTTDTVSFYQRASIICLTSECEGWPLCLAEGQAYGVVPIAFNCSAGIRDIIGTSEKYGLLVKPFNNKAFAKQLLRLATDNRLLLSLSNNVIEKSKQYNIQRNSEGYRNLLESLI